MKDYETGMAVKSIQESHSPFDWYVIQVYSKRENKLKSFIETNSRQKIDMMIFSREMLYRKAGLYRRTICPLFPGYLFVRRDIEDALKIVRSKLKNEIVRPISFDSNGPSKVNPKEMEFLIRNSDGSGTFRLSNTYKKEDEVVIVDGPLKSMAGEIVFIDEKKRKAGIEVSLFRRRLRVSLGINILSKFPEERRRTAASGERG